MKTKIQARLRRGQKTKAIIRRRGDRARLVVFRSLSHIYAQIVQPSEKGDIVIVSASTLEKEIRLNLKGSKVDQAEQIGKIIGQRAVEKSIKDVAFDRSGYQYHGRVAALAKGAREAGLNF